MPFDIPNLASASYAPQAIVTTVDFDAIVAGVAAEGVETGCAVTAQGTPNMTVAVASGTIRSANTTIAVASGNVNISAAHATLPRIDLIVVNTSGTKSAVAGTPAAYTPGTSTPVPANIPASSVLLAQVYVPPTVTAITSAMITDKRMVVTPGIPGPQGPPGATDGILVFDADTTGVSDVTNALSTALTAANTANQTLIIPPGRYRVNSTVTEKTFPIRIVCQPGAVFETYYTSGTLFKCTGSISGTATTLTAALNRGDRVLTVASTAGYIADDLVIVGNPEDSWVDAPSDPDTDSWYRWKGYQLKIRHLGEEIAGGVIQNTGTKITLYEGVPVAMATSGFSAPNLAAAPYDTLHIRKVTPIVRPIIKVRCINMAAKNTTTASFVRVKYASSIEVDVQGTGAEFKGIQIIHCYGGTVTTQAIGYTYDASGGRYGYGIEIAGACSHLMMERPESINGYSPFTTTGISNDYGEPYDITVNNARSIGSMGAGMSTHQQGRQVTFINPVVIGAKDVGMSIRGPDCTIIGGTIKDCATGIYAYANVSKLMIDGITIENMKTPVWDAAFVGVPRGYGIRISDVLSDVKLQGVTIADIDKSAISIDACSNFHLLNSELRNYNKVNDATFKHGVYCNGDLTKSRIQGNTFHDTQGVATIHTNAIRLTGTQVAAQLVVGQNVFRSPITAIANNALYTSVSNTIL